MACDTVPRVTGSVTNSAGPPRIHHAAAPEPATSAAPAAIHTRGFIGLPHRPPPLRPPGSRGGLHLEWGGRGPAHRREEELARWASLAYGSLRVGRLSSRPPMR